MVNNKLTIVTYTAYHTHDSERIFFIIKVPEKATSHTITVQNNQPFLKSVSIASFNTSFHPLLKRLPVQLISHIRIHHCRHGVDLLLIPFL